MNDEAPLNIPSAAPVLSLAIGIALAPALSPAGVCALALCATLAATRLVLRSAALLFALVAAGAALEGRRIAALESDLNAIGRIAPGSFSRVVIPIERAWERLDESSRTRSRSFVLVTDRGEEPVRIPIQITVWDDAPSLEGASHLVAEGFLRCRTSCRMSVKSARLLTTAGSQPAWHPGSWNRAALERLRDLGRSSPLARRGAAQAAALALGRGEDLDPDVREAYRRGGTYHLLVFSGMQIAFAAGAIAALFRLLGRPRPADWILLAMAIIAPPFAGNDPSVSRSATMIGVWAASRLLGRPTPIENLLFVSAGIRLAWSPGELTEPGFALTYGATGGLILIGRAFASRFRRALPRALAMSAGAELGTAPVTAHFFHQIVIGSSVLTVVLSPMFTLMLGASAAACALAFLSPDATVILLEEIGRLDAFAVWVNESVADGLRIARPVPSLPGPLIAAGFLAATLAIVLRPCAGGALAAALVLAALSAGSFAVAAYRGDAREFQVEVLDVGQGDAILIREGRRAVLVDGGGRRSDPFFTRNVLLPALADRGVLRLDAVVMTHPDPDHCAGLPPLFGSIPVRELWISPWHLRHPCGQELFSTAASHRIPIHSAERIRFASFGAFSIRLMRAEPPFRRSHWNNSSLVLLVSAGGRRILLAGDIERAAELELLEEGTDLAADVLKVAHHGSRTSGSPRFLDAVAPRQAVISAGRNNQFGHPAAESTQALAGRGVRVHRTDVHGSVLIRIRNGRIYVQREIDTAATVGNL